MKLKYNKPSTLTVCGVRLLPGINVIEDEELSEAILAHPLTKKWVDRGIIEVISRDTIMPKDVAEIYDVKKLKELAESSKKAVAEAARKQLEKIEKEGKGGKE